MSETYRIESREPIGGGWELEPNGAGFESREEAEEAVRSLVETCGADPERLRIVEEVRRDLGWWRVARSNGTPRYGYGTEQQACEWALLLDSDDPGSIDCHQIEEREDETYLICNIADELAALADAEAGERAS